MRHFKRICMTVLGTMVVATSVTADQVILDDLIVDGSACVGQDCVNGESFGFDTIRLKENNLRIGFQDTSNSASFPSNDWQLTANDSSNGGQNKFSIDDISGGRTPFTVEASAPSHSLYVDDGGRVGLGTSTPVVELHVVNGDSPTLRLEQNGSSGFTPQTWDVAGNETNFFVRDATNGSRLPFKIKPSAPTNSLYVDTDGDIGLGTASPDSGIHLIRNDRASMHLEDTSTTDATRDMLTLTNFGQTRILFADERTIPATFDWSIGVETADFEINRNGATGVEFRLADTGDLTIGGGLITGTAGMCTSGTPCDGVFAPDFEVESIEDHAQFMWENSYLRGVGATPEDGSPMNLTLKTGGVINELEKAHIFIERLNNQLKDKNKALAEMESRLSRIESALNNTN